MIITICIGSSCHLKGSKDIVDSLEAQIKYYNLEQYIHLTGSFCLNHCVKGVAVKLNDTVHSVTRDNVDEFFQSYVLPFYKEGTIY